MATVTDAALRAEINDGLERLLIVALDLEAQFAAWAGAPPRVDTLAWRGPAARAHAATTDALTEHLRAAEVLLGETARAVRVARRTADG